MKLPLAEGKYRKPAGVVAGLLACSGLAIWLFHTYVWYDYDRTRPRRADSASGRVYPLNTHGHVVYLTEAEDARLTRLAVLSFSLICGGLIAATLFVENVFVWRKKGQPWEKRKF
jgi:hypothetical protein